jgi:hypothetical protein
MNNPYEQARLRFANATENSTRAKTIAERMQLNAAIEYEEALAGLRKYESQPGIPLPKYRGRVSPDEYDPDLDDPDDDVNRKFREISDDEAAAEDATWD